MLLQPHVDLAGAGVERVLNQLLERRLQVDDHLVAADPLHCLRTDALHATTVVLRAAGPLPLGKLGELHSAPSAWDSVNAQRRERMALGGGRQ